MCSKKKKPYRKSNSLIKKFFLNQPFEYKILWLYPKYITSIKYTIYNDKKIDSSCYLLIALLITIFNSVSADINSHRLKNKPHSDLILLIKIVIKFGIVVVITLITIVINSVIVIMKKLMLYVVVVETILIHLHLINVEPK